MNHRLSFGLLLLFSLGIISSSIAQKAMSELVKVKSEKFSKYNLQYLAYPFKPKDGTKAPMIVYLHDNLSVGDNPDMLKVKGIPRMLEDGFKISAVVVAPQLPQGMGMSWNPAFVDEFVSHAIEKYKIDKNRVYVVGFSMGANGAWEYGCHYPAKVAAIVPVAGWGNPKIACNLKPVAVWAFHGSKDEIVIPLSTKNMVQAAKDCGGDVRYTELKDVKHESANDAFKYEGLYPWILSHTKAAGEKKRGRTVINESTIAYKLPKALQSITGLAYSVAGSDWYGINEKDARPMVINFDTTGRVKQLLRVENVGLISWQDMVVSDGSLYIADTGNPSYTRKTFQIYRVNEGDLRQGSAKASRVDFTISTPSPLNFKAMFIANGVVYLIGETATHERFLVKVPGEASKPVEAEIIGMLPKMDMGPIGGAVYDLPTKTLFLLSELAICEIEITSEIDVVKDYKPRYHRLPYKSQKESITIMPSGELAYADQNFLGTIDGNLYFMLKREKK